MHGIVDSFLDVILGSSLTVGFIALIAGVVTSLTPCGLAGIPLIVGVVNGVKGKRSVVKAFALSLVFAGGAALIYVVIGLVALLAGKVLHDSAWMHIVLGILLTLVALHTLDVIKLLPHGIAEGGKNRKGFLGAAVSGAFAGILSCPCATPVIFGLLSVSAKQESIFWGGAAVLLTFSMGHGLTAIVAGTSAYKIGQLGNLKSDGRFSEMLEKVIGVLLLIVAAYVFFEAFAHGH